ncbi:hypothetical protein ABMA28_015835 [Loxostege sticticalis]|uniref:FP protein C-terminal domain-containing protein n=1 Tax=Loxostege sticticalis TaxID=481309 RepID=A0ABD0TB99_LOXSC
MPTKPKPASDDCASCKKTLPKSAFMRCSQCKAAYDLECINLSSQRFYSFYKLDKKRRDAWICPECKNKTAKSSTPIRPVLSPDPNCNITLRVKSVTPTDAYSDDGTLHEDELKEDVPDSEMKMFLEEMRAVRTEMSMFRSAISDLTSTIKSLNSRLDSLESRVDVLEASAGAGSGEPDRSMVSKLEETISQLKLDIEEREQEALANDIEIASFPETPNENSTHIMLTVAKKLGVELVEGDVVSAQRMGAQRVPGSTAGAGAAARPRPIAVRLARRSQRDALLQAARVRRRLTTEDIGLPGTPNPPRHFFVNERLTRHHRQLFQRTREVAKTLDWKYVWTRDGKIFARQENGKARHRVRAESDLPRVFGDGAVGVAK